jgi:cytoskeletal protein CcmA (bactofilin family)
MFGKKDSIKEFEQMRQALKPAERFSVTADPNDGAPSDPKVAAAAAPNSVGGAAPQPQRAELVPDAADFRSSVVSIGSTWQGNLKIDGSVRIEGEVSGEVEARDTVYVAETAKVDAKVRAAHVVIAGEFEGQVECSERLEITPTGRVRAELTTKTLSVSEGAFIEGGIHMTNAKAPAPALLLAASPARDGANKNATSRAVVAPERAAAN